MPAPYNPQIPHPAPTINCETGEPILPVDAPEEDQLDAPEEE